MDQKTRAPLFSFAAIALTAIVVYGFATIPPASFTPSTNQASPTSITPSPTPPSSQSKPEQSSANWRRFTSSDESLAFSYPPQWQVTPLDQSSQLGAEVNLVQAINVSSPAPSPLTPQNLEANVGTVEIAIIDITNDPQLATAFDCSSTNLPSCETILIGSTFFSQIDFSQNTGDVVLVAPKDNKLYIISTKTLTPVVETIINTVNINSI